MKNKIIIILGPTAVGKSALGVRLAKKFNGEIISADSRQVYKGLDIGSGKITKREMGGVKHHMLDVSSPKHTYTASRYKRDSEKVIRQVFKKNKVPIIVGGTGFYIDALLGNISLPEVKPDLKLRKKLERQSPTKLFKMLEKLDSRRAITIDKNNPRRLIRAIEIAKALGRVPQIDKKSDFLSILWVGLTLPEKELRGNIQKRLQKRLKMGMVGEVKKLRKSLSWKKLESLGLEYRYVAQYLQNKITKNDPTSLPPSHKATGGQRKLRRARMIRKIEVESWRYAKRQMTWFKRNEEIVWFSPKEMARIEKLAKKFLTTPTPF